MGSSIKVQVPGLDSGLGVGDEVEGSLEMLRCESGHLGIIVPLTEMGTRRNRVGEKEGRFIWGSPRQRCLGEGEVETAMQSGVQREGLEIWGAGWKRKPWRAAETTLGAWE